MQRIDIDIHGVGIHRRRSQIIRTQQRHPSPGFLGIDPSDLAPGCTNRVHHAFQSITLIGARDI